MNLNQCLETGRKRDADAVRGHGILSRTEVGRTPSQPCLFATHTHKVTGHFSSCSKISILLSPDRLLCIFPAPANRPRSNKCRTLTFILHRGWSTWIWQSSWISPLLHITAACDPIGISSRSSSEWLVQHCYTSVSVRRTSVMFWIL